MRGDGDLIGKENKTGKIPWKHGARFSADVTLLSSMELAGREVDPGN